MQQQVTIIARMRDGSVITEQVAGLSAFVRVALPLFHDPDCTRLTWHDSKDTAFTELEQSLAAVHRALAHYARPPASVQASIAPAVAVTGGHAC